MEIYFGENLKKLRLSQGLTQEKLSDMLSVSFQTVSKWERGETYPDITVLPKIALLFNTTVDELLGVNKAENEQKIQEYLTMYETMNFKKTPELLTEFQKAITAFPNDYRILVRYMELLANEKHNPYIKMYDVTSETNNPYKNGFVKNPEYESTSNEIMKIYESIQNHCTDDSIRIWSKHIVIRHLINKYSLSFDEQAEKWYCDKKSLKMAKDILSTMPSLYDSRECVELMTYEYPSEFYSICEKNIEDLSFALQEKLISYCYYSGDDRFSSEEKIEIINHINGIFKIVDNDNYISKNRLHLIYNYGHLGDFYSQIGDNENALENLRKSALLAKELDGKLDESERISRFYERGNSFKNMTICERMKCLFTEHYSFTEDFKSTDEFNEIISLLEKA